MPKSQQFDFISRKEKFPIISRDQNYNCSLDPTDPKIVDFLIETTEDVNLYVTETPGEPINLINEFKQKYLTNKPVHLKNTNGDILKSSQYRKQEKQKGDFDKEFFDYIIKSDLAEIVMGEYKFHGNEFKAHNTNQEYLNKKLAGELKRRLASKFKDQTQYLTLLNHKNFWEESKAKTITTIADFPLKGKRDKFNLMFSIARLTDKGYEITQSHIINPLSGESYHTSEKGKGVIHTKGYIEEKLHGLSQRSYHSFEENQTFIYYKEHTALTPFFSHLSKKEDVHYIDHTTDFNLQDMLLGERSIKIIENDLRNVAPFLHMVQNLNGNVYSINKHEEIPSLEKWDGTLKSLGKVHIVTNGNIDKSFLTNLKNEYEKFYDRTG